MPHLNKEHSKAHQQDMKQKTSSCFELLELEYWYKVYTFSLPLSWFFSKKSKNDICMYVEGACVSHPTFKDLYLLCDKSDISNSLHIKLYKMGLLQWDINFEAYQTVW